MRLLREWGILSFPVTQATEPKQSLYENGLNYPSGPGTTVPWKGKTGTGKEDNTPSTAGGALSCAAVWNELDPPGEAQLPGNSDLPVPGWVSKVD